jgi:hypothetical protein
MGTITIHVSDFGDGKATLQGASIALPAKKGQGLLNRDKVAILDVVEIDIATEESVKRIAGTVGWGVAGAVILGPVGLLAGLLLGGKKKEVTFIAKFNSGEKMLATTDVKTYKTLLSICM